MKPVADEFDVIAKRLKELEAEKVTAPLPDDDELRINGAEFGNGLPSDVEPISMKKAYTIDEYWQAVRDLQAKSTPSVYGDSFWDVLVRNGVIKVGEA